MEGWRQLDSTLLLSGLHLDSFSHPIVIFKHSTRCSLSHLAWNRVAAMAGGEEKQVHFYHLDLVKHRQVSLAVAENFHVFHESPQVLVIHKGECIYEASHLEIHPHEILAMLN